jgi:hypothetical protein
MQTKLAILIFHLQPKPEYLHFCYGFAGKIRIVEIEGLLVGYSKVKWHIRIICLLLAVGFIIIPFSAADAAVETAWTQTGRADFESGTLSNLDASSSPGEVKLAISGVDYLYAFRGNDQKTFWRFNIASNTWTVMADPPDKVRWGGALAFDGSNYIYAFRGNNSNDFWRYSITGNSWAVMTGVPNTVKEGGALTYNKGYIYALRGNNTRDFWRYNPAVNTWTSLSGAHGNILSGGAITCDGGNYIYSFQENGNRAFWRYDIAADTWILLADTPAAVGAGASLTYDDSRYIYALSGDASPCFWQYDTFSDTWSIKAFIPSPVNWGGSLACAGGSYVFALPGALSQNFWRYNIAADVWEWRTGTPSIVNDGGALVRGKIKYYPSGVLESAVRDLGCNVVFGAISWQAVISLGAAIKFQVAANGDNATWNFKGPDGKTNTYYTSGGASLWSGHNGSRYVKYKAFFSASNTGITPVLDDVAITYSRQILSPTAAADGAYYVAETAASLQGKVTDDGGEACLYRFQYGKSTGNYTRVTEWSGSVNMAEFFSADIRDLEKGTKYYFRAQLKNSAGVGSSPELTLLTNPDPPVADSFIAETISATQIDLTWVKGEGARRTIVRRKTDGYPAHKYDGEAVYFDIGASFSDTGLKPMTTYYYAAWSEVSGSQQWSNSGLAVSTATLDGAPVVVGGVVYPVNKAIILGPWCGGAVIIFLAVGAAVRFFRRRKV